MKDKTKEKQLRVFDLYCDGDRIGFALYAHEVRELKREYIKNYAESGRVPDFIVVEV